MKTEIEKMLDFQKRFLLERFVLAVICCAAPKLVQADMISNLELKCSGLVTIQMDEQSKENLIENYRLSISNNKIKDTDIKLLVSAELIALPRKNIKTKLMGGKDVILNSFLIERKKGALEFEIKILDPASIDPNVKSASAKYQLDCLRLPTMESTF